MSNYAKASEWLKIAEQTKSSSIQQSASRDAQTFATLALVDEVQSLREFVAKKLTPPTVVGTSKDVDTGAEVTTHSDTGYVVATDARQALRKFMFDEEVHKTHKSARDQVSDHLDEVYRITLEVVQS